MRVTGLTKNGSIKNQHFYLNIWLSDLLKQESLQGDAKIILHCWGSLINLNTSIELASLFPKEIILVEFPITKFELNDFFIDNEIIKNSKVKLDNYLSLIENNYNKRINYKQKEKDKFRFD